jgi:hypothetical protein
MNESVTGEGKKYSCFYGFSKSVESGGVTPRIYHFVTVWK